MAETEGENLDHPSVFLPASVISDDTADSYDQIPTNRRKEAQQENMDQAPGRETTIMGFYLLDGPQTSKRATAPTLVEDEEDDVRMSKKPTVAEFFMWHHRLNHIPMNKMQKMARLGLLPKRLARCQVPACTSCLYGKVTRRPWRTKPRKGQEGGRLKAATEPGQCVSIDQLESRTPGLIAQVKGWLTNKRY
jgi:hypothetical protein